MQKIHELKILPGYFKEIISGQKTFEVRYNDRDFKVGDILCLKSWNPEKGYIGVELTVTVTYVLKDELYCKDGYAILGIKATPSFSQTDEDVEKRWIRMEEAEKEIAEMERHARLGLMVETMLNDSDHHIYKSSINEEYYLASPFDIPPVKLINAYKEKFDAENK